MIQIKYLISSFFPIKIENYKASNMNPGGVKMQMSIFGPPGAKPMILKIDFIQWVLFRICCFFKNAKLA